MRVREHLARYAVYRRALFSYVVLVAITVILLSLSLYAGFSRQSIADIAAVSRAQLRQASYGAELVYDQVLTIGSQLVDDQAIVAALNSREVDRVVEYQANRTFTRLQGVYPFIEYMAVYNGYTNRYVNPAGLTRERESAAIAFAEQNAAQGGFVAFSPRMASFGFFGERVEVPVITFVLYPNATSALASRGYIFIHVTVSYLNTILAGLTVDNVAEVAVTDDEGRVVASIPTMAFLTDISDRSYVGSALHSSSDRNSITTKIAGERVLVTHVLSEILDWHFFSSQRYDLVLSNLRATRRMTALIASVVLLAGIAVALLVTNSIHNPLTRLVTQVREAERSGDAERATSASQVNELEVLRTAYDQYVSRMALLEAAVNTDLPLLRRSYAQSLLVGMREDLPPNAELARRITSSFVGPAYRVVLYTFDHYTELRKSQVQRELSANALALAKSVRDLVVRDPRGVVVSTEENEIAALLVGNVATEAELIIKSSELQRTVGRLLGTTVSVAIAAPFNSLSGGHDALLAARAALRRRFFTGPNSVLTEGDAQDSQRRFLPYPVEAERKLVTAIRLEQREEAHKQVREFCQVLSRSTYYGALALGNQLTVELLTVFANLESEARELERYRDIALHLSSVEFLEDLQPVFLDMCSDLVKLVSNRHGDKKALLIARTIEYIDLHYMDPGLNLDALAHEQNVTPGYLGRVFRERRGRTLNDYVTEVRIEGAKKLLTETDHTAAEVAEMVGISNSSYFYTLFRKIVGTTPARYRNQNRRQP